MDPRALFLKKKKGKESPHKGREETHSYLLVH
jgi:hypothetical protein